jgi:DNA topoisomerase-1
MGTDILVSVNDTRTWNWLDGSRWWRSSLASCAHPVCAPAQHYTSASEAHEAVRPTDPARTPEVMAATLSPQQYKLYDLIWRRFMASQMSDAVFDATAIDITAKQFGFRANGSVLKFDGWLKVLPSKFEDNALPLVRTGETLALQELKPEQHFTKPPFIHEEVEWELVDR